MPQERTRSLLVASVQISQKYSNSECQLVHTNHMQRIDWGIVCLKESSATERPGERGWGCVYIRTDSFPPDFSHLKNWRGFIYLFILSAPDIREVSSIRFSLHLRNFSYPFNRTDQVMWSLAKASDSEKQFQEQEGRVKMVNKIVLEGNRRVLLADIRWCSRKWKSSSA